MDAPYAGNIDGVVPFSPAPAQYLTVTDAECHRERPSPHADALPKRILAEGGIVDGVVCVDTDGRLTFVSDGARALVRGHDGAAQLGLGELLTGGPAAAAALLESAARQHLIEESSSILIAPIPLPVRIIALALRDRDGHLSGTALFIRPESRPPAEGATGSYGSASP